MHLLIRGKETARRLQGDCKPQCKKESVRLGELEAADIRPDVAAGSNRKICA